MRLGVSIESFVAAQIHMIPCIILHVNSLRVNEQDLLLSWSLSYTPHGNFTEEIIFQFQLLHLTIPHCTIFTIEKFVFHFKKRTNILASKCNFDSKNEMRSEQNNCSLETQLAANQVCHPMKIVVCCATFAPHADEEMRCKCVGFAEVKEERLKSC